MGRFICLLFVLIWMYFVQGKTFEIKIELINGDLKFSWSNVSTHRNDITITRNGHESGWIQVTDDEYTVEDVWRYKSITIRVREYTKPVHRDYYSTYNVNKDASSSWAPASSSGVPRVNKNASSSRAPDPSSGVPRVNKDASSSWTPAPRSGVPRVNKDASSSLSAASTSGVPRDPPNPSQKTNSTPIVIGVSVALFILIVIVTVAITIFFRRRKSKQQQQNHNRMSDTIRIDESSQPDVAQYATVDKSIMLRNRKQADRMTGDTVENKDEDDEDVKNPNPSHAANVETNGSNFAMTTKKCGIRTSQDEDEKSTDTSNDKKGSKTVNQDGLVYIDVAFAQKPESSDTNVKSVIHGEQDKTEYTFVYFSKKAPPIQEMKDNVNMD